MLDLREQLDELGAVPTLLRTLRENTAVPVVASIVMATAVLDPGVAAAAPGSAAGIALAAREVLTLRKVKRHARQQPYWYLHAIQRALHRRRR